MIESDKLICIIESDPRRALLLCGTEKTGRQMFVATHKRTHAFESI